jgi:hypothetical protein
LLGFNTNIRHKGKVFHIQTEDSGIKHPHVITHLFADGRILKSVKTSYAEHLSVENLSDKVRSMMNEQHKAMLMALRDGSFDSVIDESGLGAKPKVQAAPPRPAPPVQPPVEAAGPASVRADPEAARAWVGVQLPHKSGAQPEPPQAPASQQAHAPPAPNYAASRPAAIFASARPTDGRNLFGEEMISDKPLDEVILSFLAEEYADHPGDGSGSGKR